MKEQISDRNLLLLVNDLPVESPIQSTDSVSRHHRRKKQSQSISLANDDETPETDNDEWTGGYWFRTPAARIEDNSTGRDGTTSTARGKIINLLEKDDLHTDETNLLEGDNMHMDGTNQTGRELGSTIPAKENE